MLHHPAGKPIPPCLLLAALYTFTIDALPDSDSVSFGPYKMPRKRKKNCHKMQMWNALSQPIRASFYVWHISFVGLAYRVPQTEEQNVIIFLSCENRSLCSSGKPEVQNKVWTKLFHQVFSPVPSSSFSFVYPCVTLCLSWGHQFYMSSWMMDNIIKNLTLRTYILILKYKVLEQWF